MQIITKSFAFSASAYTAAFHIGNGWPYIQSIHTYIYIYIYSYVYICYYHNIFITIYIYA